MNYPPYELLDINCFANISRDERDLEIIIIIIPLKVGQAGEKDREGKRRIVGKQGIEEGTVYGKEKQEKELDLTFTLIGMGDRGGLKEIVREGIR